MHVLFENLMKQLLGLWKGTYKATMMTGDPTIDEDYVLSEHQWDLIDREVAQSTKLVPAQMAPSLTSVTERGYWNADSYAYVPRTYRDEESTSFALLSTLRGSFGAGAAYHPDGDNLRWPREDRVRVYGMDSAIRAVGLISLG